VPTQPAIQLVPGAISPRLKRPEREANSSPPSSAEAKNSWIYNFHSRMRLHGELLSKAQGQFTVTSNILKIINFILFLIPNEVRANFKHSTLLVTKTQNPTRMYGV